MATVTIGFINAAASNITINRKESNGAQTLLATVQPGMETNQPASGGTTFIVKTASNNFTIIARTTNQSYTVTNTTCTLNSGAVASTDRSGSAT